jgi:hypothetical protein
LQKQLIQWQQTFVGMPQEVPNGLKDLIVQFVQTYSSVPDLELDLYLSPKPWFMPLNSDETKQEATHYFLLAAALSDYKLTGNPRNVRLLLDHLYNALGPKLYTSKNVSEFTVEINKFEHQTEKFDHLGQAKAEISEVICSVNQFVENKAQGNLIDYTTKLALKNRKPADFVKELSFAVKRMSKHHKAKSWLYLRWMVRSSPDLALFKFNPKDLMVSLTTPKFRVYAALGLSDNDNLPFKLSIKNQPESWWVNTSAFDADSERLTNFSQSLFPEDPAKVDFPFFILGTWLEYSDLTPASLEKSMQFFIRKHEEFLQPLMKYLTVIYHYNRIGERIDPGAFSALELDVYDYLRKKQVVFNYEFMEFCLSKENPAFTYKPDFLLPQITNNGRKVLLEPHGIRSNLIEFLAKLAVFRKHYGEYFCLILIVPDHYVKIIEKFDTKHSACDFLWKQSNYKTQFENFRSS